MLCLPVLGLATSPLLHPPKAVVLLLFWGLFHFPRYPFQCPNAFSFETTGKQGRSGGMLLNIPPRAGLLTPPY